MVKQNDTQQKEQTMEEYLLSQLAEPVILKDGSVATSPDGKPLTKQQAIATNLLNLAMKGDTKAIMMIQTIQTRDRLNRNKRKK